MWKYLWSNNKKPINEAEWLGAYPLINLCFLSISLVLISIKSDIWRWHFEDYAHFLTSNAHRDFWKLKSPIDGKISILPHNQIKYFLIIFHVISFFQKAMGFFSGRVSFVTIMSRFFLRWGRECCYDYSTNSKRLLNKILMSMTYKLSIVLWVCGVIIIKKLKWIDKKKKLIIYMFFTRWVAKWKHGLQAQIHQFLWFAGSQMDVILATRTSQCRKLSTNANDVLCSLASPQASR